METIALFHLILLDIGLPTSTIGLSNVMEHLPKQQQKKKNCTESLVKSLNTQIVRLNEDTFEQLTNLTKYFALSKH